MGNIPMTPGDYREILNRRKWSIVLPAIIIFLAAAAVALALPSIYQSKATILIEEQEIPSDFVTATITGYAEQRIQAINKRIMSFSRLSKIIQQFDPYPELKDRMSAEEIVAKMIEDTKLELVSTEIVDRRTGKPTSATIAFTLSYEGKNPDTVQQVASVLVWQFISENLQVREKQTQETSAFLETELAKIKKELDEIESRIAAFKSEHINELPELLQVNLQALNNIDNNLASANQQLRSLKGKQEYLRIQLVSVKPHNKTEEEIASRKRVEELKVQLVHLTKRFSEEYPDVKKTRAEIKDLEKTLADMEAARKLAQEPPDNPAYISLAAQLASARAEAASLRGQIEQLNTKKNEYSRRFAAMPRVEETYNELVTARNNIQAKYNDLMGKLMEARVAQGLEKVQKGERFTLIDPARLPEKPFKPNRWAIMLIGVVLGIGAGIGFASLREFSDDSVRNADQLEFATKYPVLAGIPNILTNKDMARRRFKRIAWVIATVGIFIGGLALFHFAVMDLNVFWAKLMLRLAL